MKCLILAAGYATRLYPLTEDFPKPLLKVGKKTILDWLVDDINTIGLVDEYIVVTNHKHAAHFAAWAQERQEKITIVDDGTSSNETRRGAVKDIQFAIEQQKITDDLLVVAGDNVLDFSLAGFVAYAKSKEHTCIMRYYASDATRLRRSGVVQVDENDLVITMEEKPVQPKSNWCVPPFYIYTKEDIHLIRWCIESGCKADAPGSCIEWMCKQTPVYAMEMPGKRYDIGDLESYRVVQETYQGIVTIVEK